MNGKELLEYVEKNHDRLAEKFIEQNLSLWVEFVYNDYINNRQED